MKIDLDALTDEEFQRGADLFAQISYREREFGKSTDLRFPHGDFQTLLHFEMAIEALKALAAGKTHRDLDEDKPYFDHEPDSEE